MNVDETAPLRPDSPALYSATKAEAEQLVRDASRDGFETVVLRPRFVWGAGDTTLLPEIIAATEAGRFAWVGGGTHRTSITHVDNVVEGLLLAAENGPTGQGVLRHRRRAGRVPRVHLEAARGARRRTADAVRADFGRRRGRRGGELAWRLLPLRGEPPLTRFAFWAASQECTIDDSKARRELGYVPVTSQEQGLAALAT